MVLIFQIAAGIVLAILFFAFLPKILEASIWLGALALVIVVIGGLIYWVIEARGQIQKIGIYALLMLIVAVGYKLIEVGDEALIARKGYSLKDILKAAAGVLLTLSFLNLGLHILKISPAPSIAPDFGVFLLALALLAFIVFITARYTFDKGRLLFGSWKQGRR